MGKRSRHELAAEYVRRYTTEILDSVDLSPIMAALLTGGPAALLCVERDPEACHRSLIAQRLAEQHHVFVEHLRPRDDSPWMRRAARGSAGRWFWFIPRRDEASLATRRPRGSI